MSCCLDIDIDTNIVAKSNKIFVITFNGFVWINQIVEANSLQIWLFQCLQHCNLEDQRAGCFYFTGHWSRNCL